MWAKRSLPARGNERFVARRKERRRRILYLGSVLGLVLIVGLLYLLNQPYLRISRVEIFGADASLSSIVTDAMHGSTLWIIPRDSIVFYAGESIRRDLMAADSDIAAVSLFRNGLTGLTVRVAPRIPIAAWCGASYARPLASSTPTALEGCTYFDSSGVLYATTTAEQVVNSFSFYEEMSSTTSAIGATLPNASLLPRAFDFARELASFGSPVVAVVFRESEVDDYLESGTRISYVRGHEQAAFTALTSARDQLLVNDGSVEYVDLRFDGKVYVKRRGESAK